MINPFEPSEYSVVLTGCCLICDRVEVSGLANGQPKIRNACDCCRSDIQTFLSEGPGNSVDPVDSIQEIAVVLRSARMPLICGLTDQSVQVQQAATDLARRCNAVIDWTVGNRAAALQHALQNVGLVSCTWQEIRERADLVVFWGCEVSKTHPAFVDRFISDKPVINIRWDRDRQIRALRFLRSVNAAENPDSELTELNQRLDRARYPVIVIDDLLATSIGDAGVNSLFRFVRAQNDINHCRLIHLSNPGNTAGIRSTMSSMTNGPFGVAFRDGLPCYRGREFCVESMIANGVVDAILLVGSSGQLPDTEIGKHVRKIQIVDRASDPEFKQFDAELSIRIRRWGLG